MKKTHFIFYALIAAVLVFTGCEDEEVNNVGSQAEQYDFTSALNDYVDKTVIPTYQDMKDNAILLASKTKEFEASGKQEDLNAACDYWVETREPWEASEAFLFGPAAFNNLDPLLDSWPLDQNQLQQVLDGDQELTADFVRDGLGAVLRGFHAVEFLLFRDGEPRMAESVTTREKDYLVAVSQVLMEDCVKLWALWEGGESEQEILDAIELEVDKPYGEEFKNAGQAGSRYVSQVDAVDELVQGMIAIADEVANGKIAEPHETGNVYTVESWFSWNSLTDFKNNMRSIENGYLGGYHNNDTRGTGLTVYIQEQDPDLDAKVKQAITDAIDAIDAIPEPFRNNLKHENVQPAMDAINNLMAILDGEVRTIIVD